MKKKHWPTRHLMEAKNIKANGFKLQGISRFFVAFICLGIVSCARMPVQAVELSHALKEEGQRMHSLNLTLVEYVFNEKKHLVNEFINNEYSPALIENFKTLLPASIDVKKELVEIMQAINPKIAQRRDSLLQVLQEQKNMISQKLNADYKVYEEAFTAMQNLLASAARLNTQRESVYADLKALSNNRINLQGIDNALNQFILGAGSVGEKTVLLTNSIQTFLK
ncbi:MAG: hypothetical protein H7X88_12460 [Gloeobacteraceae cyanobacterium ES-bin-316]|nr:hypothetical protein [Ferruginibacter sp.]